MILELKEKSRMSIEMNLKFNLNHERLVSYNGSRYIGRFFIYKVAEYLEELRFNWNGSVFPQGIPYECLDSVWEIAELK